MIITSSTKSWLGPPNRFLIATNIPSWSKPLYTSPNFPSPIKLMSLKFFVARDNSAISKCLASRKANSTPTFLPTASYESNKSQNDCYFALDSCKTLLKVHIITLPWTEGSEDPVSEVLETLLLWDRQNHIIRITIPTNATAPAAPPRIAARVLDIWHGNQFTYMIQ